MTQEDINDLKVGNIIKCIANYMDCYTKNQEYTIHKIEICLGDKIFTLKTNKDERVITWPLKTFELILWFDKIN